MYNSILFVPATEKLLPKIEECSANMVIIDLEDAIPDNEKTSALCILKTFLEEYSYSKDIYVRINCNRLREEIQVLNCYDIKGYMLPKTESVSDIEKISCIANKKNIVALVETAMGIINIGEIAKSDKISMIAFGAEDYTTQCKIKNDSLFLAYPKSKIVAYSKAFNKPVFDTISLNITDKELYRKEVYDSYNYGFDGKLAIHPMQIDIINEIYHNIDIEYYKHIIYEYEKNGQGVLNINGKVFERPHIEQIKRKLKEFYNG